MYAKHVSPPFIVNCSLIDGWFIRFVRHFLSFFSSTSFFGLQFLVVFRVFRKLFGHVYYLCAPRCVWFLEGVAEIGDSMLVAVT